MPFDETPLSQEAIQKMKAEAPTEIAPGIFVGDPGPVELFLQLARNRGEMSEVDKWLKSN